MGDSLTGRRAGGLAGALGLLLALCIIAGIAAPAYADDMGDVPQPPHGFAGTVIVDGAPVAEGTLVEAFVDGVKRAETTVDAQARYLFLVPGVSDATVTFRVDGVLANERAIWQSGTLQDHFDLTVGESRPPINRPLIGGIIAAAVVVVAGLIIFLVRRRKTA